MENEYIVFMSPGHLVYKDWTPIASFRSNVEAWFYVDRLVEREVSENYYTVRKREHPVLQTVRDPNGKTGENV